WARLRDLFSYSRLYDFIDVFFFFQAEDGIRDFHVTGVQTCALPISLVMHIDPEPTPTLTASTPALMRSRAPSPVAMFPAINSQFGKAFLIMRTVFIAFSLWPCAMSTTSTSAPASSRASARSR